MHTLKATIVLGALLSTGMLVAQAPDATQAPAANVPQAMMPISPGGHEKDVLPANRTKPENRGLTA